jgi:hypothetical protein
MTDNSIDPRSGDSPDSVDPHADKYNDPRVKITLRGVLLLVLVFVLGIVGAAASVYLRRTQLEQSTEFWGLDTITALQLAERMELLARGDARFDPVELSGTPGLGHLRRLLLDERNYDWQTETRGSVSAKCDQVKSDALQCIQLRLTDPTAHRFGTIEIDIDLSHGWIGPADGSHRVRVAERVLPKLQSYFSVIITVEQLRYDERQSAASERS